MESKNTPNTQLIAPCGINCGVCLAYLRTKNKCEGCWGSDTKKPKHCVACSIKNCEHLLKTTSKFCYDCEKYPCSRIKQLDKRYRTKYKMSIIDNLLLIKESGLSNFIQLDKIKWSCKNCGGTICVHRGYCLDCDNMSNRVASINN
ncbi:MAG: DUF3795 domain-containing protein [Bacteroidales bacterium]|nr:MAG: DUF3795 domain-containing protein [Bacteroidales bacterium]